MLFKEEYVGKIVTIEHASRGQVIMGRLMAEDEDCIHLSEAMAMNFQEAQGGQVQVQLGPVTYLLNPQKANGEVVGNSMSIPKMNVALAYTDAVKEYVDVYERALNPKKIIAPPSKEIII